MRRFLATLATACAVMLAPAMVRAAGNLASQPTTLELAIDGRNLTFSATEYTLETGKYYRWAITSDGIEEVMLQATDLFGNSWINQIVINDLEVHPFGGIYGVEFDDEGEVVIFFIPLRPGDYEFFVPGYEDRGLLGKFIVR